MNKAAFFKLEPWAAEYLKNHPSLKEAGIDSVFYDEALNKSNIPSGVDFEIGGVFVDSLVDKEVIDSLPNVKFFATLSTGYDHVDLEECRKRSIAVSNVPYYGENTVAEFTFALMLSLSRKIYDAYDQVRETGSFSVSNLRGFDLKGKTLGVIGTGHIGIHVIKIAKGFDMNVVAYDVRPKSETSSSMGFEYKALEEVLKESDIVTLHVPYMKETHHLLDGEKIKMMKSGSYLINTSRGPVVQTEALVNALKEGHLGGAALDVLEEEGAIRDELEFLTKGHPEEHNLKTILANHVLIDMPNVIITPHNAFNTQEAMQRILDTTAENIVAFINGNPQNTVT